MAVSDNVTDPCGTPEGHTWILRSSDWSSNTKRIIKQSWDDFGALSVLANLPFESASEPIRKHLKSYIVEMYSGACGAELFLSAPERKLYASGMSFELEEAIAKSKAILDMPIDPDDGADVAYAAATWSRATMLLRRLADLFWLTSENFLPVPAIAPAVGGSIDLFWEVDDVTLLINVPAGEERPSTFYGRRRSEGKISGVLDRSDDEPRHLIGWLFRA